MVEEYKLKLEERGFRQQNIILEKIPTLGFAGIEPNVAKSVSN